MFVKIARNKCCLEKRTHFLASVLLSCLPPGVFVCWCAKERKGDRKISLTLSTSYFPPVGKLGQIKGNKLYIKAKRSECY